MPPKPKFKKEEIIDAAFELIRSDGPDALTARELGKRLGVSSSPIFTFFNDMNELKQAVTKFAKARFDEYMSIAEEFYPAYKKRGMQFIRFASDEPQLFKLLFMQKTDGNLNFNDAISIIPFGKENDIAIIKRDYNATDEQAQRLFDQMWIYTYGLCVLSAQGVCKFTDEEISQRLGEIFKGMVFVISDGKTSTLSTKLMPLEHTDGQYENTKKIGPKFSGK